MLKRVVSKSTKRCSDVKKCSVISNHFDGVPPEKGFWSTAPDGPLGLEPWPAEFTAVQGPASVVVLSIHAAGRPRKNTQMSLSTRVQLHAAAAWMFAPG